MTLNTFGLQLFDDSTCQQPLVDWTTQVDHDSIEVRTDKRGYATMTFVVPMGKAEARRYYNALAAQHLFYGSFSLPVFVGRVDAKRTTSQGLEIGAVGYAAAFTDRAYTALWSAKNKVMPWIRVITEEERSGYLPNRYQLDQENRLHAGLMKNNQYGNQDHAAAWAFQLPKLGNKPLARVSFSYEARLPTNWVAQVYAAEDDWSNRDGQGTVVTGNGSATPQTGSFSDTSLGTDKAILEIILFNNTGTTYTNSADTDYWYLTITSLRVWTHDDTEVTAQAVAQEAVSYARADNTTQLSAATCWIEDPGVDLEDLWFEDIYGQDVLDRLLQFGDDQTPPRLWEASVWDDLRLRFVPRGEYGLTFSTDVQELDLSESISDVWNQVYAYYNDDTHLAGRTADADDDESQARYGLIRRLAWRARTGSATQAGNDRDYALERYRKNWPRATIRATGLYPENGGEAVPLASLRSGDTLILRNLGTIGQDAFADIERFVVGSTLYLPSRNVIQPTPEGDESLFNILVAGIT